MLLVYSHIRLSLACHCGFGSREFLDWSLYPTQISLLIQTLGSEYHLNLDMCRKLHIHEPYACGICRIKTRSPDPQAPLHGQCCLCEVSECSLVSSVHPLQWGHSEAVIPDLDADSVCSIYLLASELTPGTWWEAYKDDPRSQAVWLWKWSSY